MVVGEETRTSIGAESQELCALERPPRAPAFPSRYVRSKYKHVPYKNITRGPCAPGSLISTFPSQGPGYVVLLIRPCVIDPYPSDKTRPQETRCHPTANWESSLADDDDDDDDARLTCARPSVSLWDPPLLPAIIHIPHHPRLFDALCLSRSTISPARSSVVREIDQQTRKSHTRAWACFASVATQREKQIRPTHIPDGSKRMVDRSGNIQHIPPDAFAVFAGPPWTRCDATVVPADVNTQIMSGLLATW